MDTVYVVTKTYWFDGSKTIAKVFRTEDAAKKYCENKVAEEKHENESNNGLYVNDYDYDEIEFQ